MFRERLEKDLKGKENSAVLKWVEHSKTKMTKKSDCANLLLVSSSLVVGRAVALYRERYAVCSERMWCGVHAAAE